MDERHSNLKSSLPTGIKMLSGNANIDIIIDVLEEIISNLNDTYHSTDEDYRDLVLRETVARIETMIRFIR